MIQCAVELDLARQEKADSQAAAMASEIERELEAMRADDSRLFMAIGDMGDYTLRQLCHHIAFAVTAVDADDRLAAIHDMTAIIDAANLRDAIDAVEAKEQKP